MADCQVLFSLAKMQPNHVFQKQVGVDRESAEGLLLGIRARLYRLVKKALLR
jgi:hypothetical protein